MKKTSTLLSVIALLIIAGCAKPEGPAQRMGRSIDELSKSVKDIGEEWDTESDRETRERLRNEERLREEERRRREDRDYSRGRAIPDHDPYYDTPPNSPDYDREEAERLERERNRRDPYRPERY